MTLPGVKSPTRFLLTGETTTAKQKPAAEFRLGRITAAVWRNSGTNGDFYSVTPTRLYKPEGGDWQRSDSFGRDDLPLVSKVCDMAHTWIYEQVQAD